MVTLGVAMLRGSPQGKTEEITGHHITSESNKMVREAMQNAREALSNADACHQHVIISAKQNKQEEVPERRDGCGEDGTGPTEERLRELTVAVARAVVLVDGVGHCIDAAAGGTSGTASTLAEEAAMLSRAGKLGGKAEYKGRGRGGNALTDFTSLKGKMDASRCVVHLNGGGWRVWLACLHVPRSRSAHALLCHATVLPSESVASSWSGLRPSSLTWWGA